MEVMAETVYRALLHFRVLFSLVSKDQHCPQLGDYPVSSNNLIAISVQELRFLKSRFSHIFTSGIFIIPTLK